jgi:hypothetical protein
MGPIENHTFDEWERGSIENHTFDEGQMLGREKMPRSGEERRKQRKSESKRRRGLTESE